MCDSEAECKFDLSRSDCSCCETNGVQCGEPMQQYCTKKEEGRQAGCLGVPTNHWTLSTTGYPCVTSTHLVPTVPGVQLEVLSVVSPETRDPTLQLGPGVGTLMILATVTVYQGTAYISICVTQRLSVKIM